METKTAVIYARVSTEKQNDGGAPSIKYQLSDSQALAKRNNWKIAGEFVDATNYRATQKPFKGKMVNPSGTRADRPQFQAMLQLVETGEVDVIICWHDSRLYRHGRVAVALNDALDAGDLERKGKSKIQIYEARNGTAVEARMIYLKALFWHEENKAKRERSIMGHKAVLQAGRLPTYQTPYGYTTIKEPGKNGRIPVLDEEKAPWVKKIFEWRMAGYTARQIREELIANNVPQFRDNNAQRQYTWALRVIYDILKQTAYYGDFHYTLDGEEYVIPMPPLITRQQYDLVQRLTERNKGLSRRNAKYPSLLRGLVYCGCCGTKLVTNFQRYYYYKREKRKCKKPHYYYRCERHRNVPEEPHDKPNRWQGHEVDRRVWEYLVEEVIYKPEVLQEQLSIRQTELQGTKATHDGEIGKVERELQALEKERKFYLRQAGREQITEAELDTILADTTKLVEHWEEELQRLKELRDDAQMVEDGLDYIEHLMMTMGIEIDQVDVTHDELLAMPEESQMLVLEARRRIALVLLDKVELYSDGKVRCYLSLDGSEFAQFELAGRCPTPHSLFEKSEAKTLVANLAALRPNWLDLCVDFVMLCDRSAVFAGRGFCSGAGRGRVFWRFL